MDGRTVPEIIGDLCDHRDCSAPQRVAVQFTAGELHFCRHHWQAVELTVAASPAFVSAHDLTRETELTGAQV